MYTHTSTNGERRRQDRGSVGIPWPLEREGANGSLANVIDRCSKLELNDHGAQTDLTDDVGRKHLHV